jgi:hypothetical protein
MLLSFFLIAAAFLNHEFYVGLTDIEYNTRTETYQVSMKLFTDDLDLALEKTGSISEETPRDTLIFRYLRKHFQLEGEENAISLRPIGSETEADVTWIYLESGRQEPSAELLVLNDVFMEIFKDQTHIIHFIANGDIQSEITHRGNTSVKFKLND